MHTPSPDDYPPGAIKQDPATLAVAVRTSIAAVDNGKDWGVMTLHRGGYYTGWDEVSHWADR
jgi:hypothetical protein